MKIHTALALSLLTGWGLSTAACGSSTPPIGTGGVPGTGGIVASGGAGVGGGSGGIVSSGGAIGTGGGSGGDMALGGTCNVASMEVQDRSDTDGDWDDPDFSAGVTIAGTCPVVIDVTWPHEVGWEDGADLVDSDFEETYFNLDVYPGVDFTGKQINLTIELSAETLGPTSAYGGAIIQLMSTSTFEVPVAGSGGAGSGGAGSGGASSGGASSGGASSGGASSGGAASGGDTGSGGAATTTSYTDAYGEEEVLATVGEKLTLSFVLPAKGPNNNSYDPATAIKMTIRVRPNWTDIGAPPPTLAFLTSQFEITEFSLTDAETP